MVPIDDLPTKSLRILARVGHRFRRMSDTDAEHLGHPIRSMSDA